MANLIIGLLCITSGDIKSYLSILLFWTSSLWLGCCLVSMATVFFLWGRGRGWWWIVLLSFAITTSSPFWGRNMLFFFKTFSNHQISKSKTLVKHIFYSSITEAPAVSNLYEAWRDTRGLTGGSGWGFCGGLEDEFASPFVEDVCVCVCVSSLVYKYHYIYIYLNILYIYISIIHIHPHCYLDSSV